MFTILLFLLAVIGLLVSGIIFHRLKNSKLGIFHPLIILLGLASIDVFVPGIIWSISGIKPSTTYWKETLLDVDVVSGIFYYIIFYFLMLAALARALQPISNSNLENINANKRILALLLFVSFSFSYASLWVEVSEAGGFSSWFLDRTQSRWAGELNSAQNQSLFIGLIKELPWRIIFNSLVLCAFYFRYQHARKIVYGYFFPILSVLLSLTTFYRGSILVLVVGFAFVEYVRLKNVGANNIKVNSFQLEKAKKRAVRYSAIAVVTFLLFGLTRNYFVNNAWDVRPNKQNYLVEILSVGHGLEGISQIIRFYDRGESLFLGKTYFDMLLLPVPRSVYTSKPEWYGIDDITRRMGWPRSTQSAVTIPGEAYANFSWVGLIVAPIFGAIIGWLVRLCLNSNNKIYMFLYPGVVFYIFTISNWMSFTGVMNQLIPFVSVYCALYLVSSTKTFRLFRKIDTKQQLVIHKQ